MVVRKEKRKRKYLGTRRWGVGNIKNARGHGSKGGAGRGGKKHKFTYVTAKMPDSIRHVGFTPWNQRKLREITLKEIERRLPKTGDRVISLKSYKVLSNGTLSSKATIKASGFSKGAQAKIKSTGGEAIIIK